MNSIFKWCGRFGNNIQQLSNAIYFAKTNKYHFFSPDHEFIKPFDLKFGHIPCPSRLYFFHVDSETNQGPKHFICDVGELKKQRKKICEDYIYPNLKIDISKYEPFDDNTLVFHVRGGDIFSRQNYYCPVISRYIQSPLFFYKNIINRFDKIIVLTEDFSNPIIPYLEKYKNIDIKITSLQETIITLLRSRNVATGGVSSFPIATSLISKNLKNLYTTNLFVNEILNYTDINSDAININIFNIDLNNYIKYNEWINTEEQRKKMIEYE